MYNTIRLAIYAAREEIHVMRLVGAQKRYVHGPFMVEGLITGVLGAIITAIIWYPLSLLITSKMSDFFQGFSFVKYYGENFIQIFVIMIVWGIIVGMISAGLCVNKFINQGQE
jgi:cell division transport system permease protein